MSINSISLGNCTCACSSVDYEQIQIELRLKAYGIEPSGNKTADKSKLHAIELQYAKMQNAPSGKFLTVSYSKEQEIINNKKENLNPYKNIKSKTENKEILKEDEVLGRQILAIIEMKKREEKDYKKSKKLRTDGINKTAKSNSQDMSVSYSPKPTNIDESESGDQNLSVKKEIKN